MEISVRGDEKNSQEQKRNAGGPIRLRSGQVLHFAAHDEAVSSFGRNDDLGFVGNNKGGVIGAADGSCLNSFE